uniref:PGAP2-interacting protein n=1 Tax=Ciona savignyi TaxID=51511 RepID=H2ZJA9_CIOSA
TDSFLVPLACECVIGYTFWSLVHGLGPMIWFYPLNELDITGYELFVLVAFSPILFLLGENTQKFLSRTPVVNFFMLLMLVGAASFHASSTLSRLISLSIGVGAAFIVQTVTWWSGTQKERRIHFWGYTLGFVALLASRIWYVSMTPLWNDHKSNKVIVSLFTATIAAKLIFQQSEDAPQEEKQKKTKKDKSTYSPLVVSLGYGAVFFFLHALLGEVSIIPRYTVSGFPNTGPMPNPWGGLVLLGITLGLLLSFYTSIASQWMWSVIGFASGMGLMFLPTCNCLFFCLVPDNVSYVYMVCWLLSVKWLIIVLWLGLSAFLFQCRRRNITSCSLGRPPPSKNFPHLIWTFHFGYDNRGWPSLDRAAELLSNTGADVITLLESDASKPYLGNNDIAMWLGEKLGMYSDFGPSTRDHTWGSLRNLILSKYPIVNSTHHLLPSPEGELAPAISTTINISGSMVDFVVTHMGNDRDDLDRRQQAAKLSQLCSESRNPVVFLGYVTSSPGSRDYNKLTRDGRMKDIDPTDRDRWCEYIMYRDLIKLGYARISHGGLSDTELQMGRWRIPQGEHTDNFKLTTSDDKIPQSIRFNTVFGSHYVGHWYGGGHHFHMSTPKYFV